MRISKSKRWDSIVRSRVIVVECKGQAKASTTMPWGNQKRPWGDFDREVEELLVRGRLKVKETGEVVP